MKAKGKQQQKKKKRHRGVRAQTAAIAALARVVCWTCRLRTVDHAGVLDGKNPGPFIYVCWHNRLLFFPPCSPRRLRLRTKVLTSISRDGEAAARYIRHFGIESVRGSSSRGGFKALVQLRRVLAGGDHVFITPDGPRGPKYSIQPGPVLLARKSGAAVVPVTLNASRYWGLKGWDGTQVAKPFSSLELVVGAPVAAQGLADLPIEAARERVREALLEITCDSAGDARL